MKERKKKRIEKLGYFCVCFVPIMYILIDERRIVV